MSHYVTKDGAELDALVDENNKIYLGRRDRYDNHGHYINDGKSLLYLSDNEKMFDFISGGGYPDTQAELLAQGCFTMEDYAEFDALRVRVLAQFEQTEPLLFAGEPFSFIQPDAAELEQPAPEPLEQTDAALYLVDGSTYLHIQLSDGGYDYTLYDKATLRQLDGGQMAILDVGGSPQANFRNAADLIILGVRNLQGTSVEPVPLDMLDTLRNAEEQAAVTEVQDQQKNHLDVLREHFSQEDDALWDTQLDEYPLPDPAFPADELEQNYGYMGGDLLPLSRERAAELLEQDLTVYMVVTGENPTMVFDQDDLMEQPEGMMFAVAREEWEASQDFRQAVLDRMQRQRSREEAFLNHAADCFAIYQIRDDDALRDIRFESLDWLESKGRAVERDNYDLVYTATLSAFASVDAALDHLWYQFNNEHPADFQHPSMSVSDIIALKRDGVVTCHYCDSFGFKQLADFISQKPTVAELEAQVKAGQSISLTDLADANHRERGQKKSVVAQLKKQPIQKRNKTAPKKSAEKER